MFSIKKGMSQLAGAIQVQALSLLLAVGSSRETASPVSGSRALAHTKRTRGPRSSVDASARLPADRLSLKPRALGNLCRVPVALRASCQIAANYKP